MVAISLHVLAAVYWAGSTFALAGMGGSGSERLFRPQMAAAAIAILSGGYLWHTLHHGVFGTMEKVLHVGIASALVALAVQAVVSVARSKTCAGGQMTGTPSAGASLSRIGSPQA